MVVKDQDLELILHPKAHGKIDKDPIIVHIMRIFKRQGFNDFILASGYKTRLLKNILKK